MEMRLWEETLRDLKRRRYLGVDAAEGERREEDGAVEMEGGAAGVGFDFAGFAFDLKEDLEEAEVEELGVELEAEVLMRLEVRRSAGMVLRKGERGGGRWRGDEEGTRSFLTVEFRRQNHLGLSSRLERMEEVEAHAYWKRAKSVLASDYR